MSKKYGLLKPGEIKKPIPNFSRPSVFNDDSSDDDEVKPQKIGLTTLMQRKQAKLIQEKALEDDPTVYQYDELYDDISAKKKEEKAKKSEDKQPKYIGKLLKAAEHRKIENERRIERQVQREREEEGEKFKDKESFVTASYRKKLEELRKAEEEEAREAYLESIGDVRKQGNLDGFYRHIYAQKLDDEKVVVKPEIPQETPASSSTAAPKSKTRSYRKRKSSENANDEEETEAVKKAHLENNLDADSDFSIDSSSDEEEKEEKKPQVVDDAPEFVKPSEPIETPKVVEIKTEVPDVVNGKEPELKVEPPKKERIDIWKKRTVGDVFDACLQRYYERKALREQG